LVPTSIRKGFPLRAALEELGPRLDLSPRAGHGDRLQLVPGDHQVEAEVVQGLGLRLPQDGVLKCVVKIDFLLSIFLSKFVKIYFVLSIFLSKFLSKYVKSILCYFI
jgi:hypothetical protein